MGVFVLIVILVGAALALVAAMAALGAYLRLRRTRLALEAHLVGEVTRLTRRTGELESGLSALDARASQVPLRISDLQQNLGTLRVLTKALAVSLGQAQRVLSYNTLEALSFTRIGGLLRSPPAKNGRRSG